MLNLFSKYKDSFLKFGSLAILMAIPLYPKFPFVRVPGTYVSIRLEDFLLFVVFAAWFFSTVPKWRLFLKDRINQSFIIFIGVSLLSLFSAFLVTQTVIFHIGLLHWVRRIEYFTAFFIGVSAIKKEENILFYLKSLFVVITILFFFGIGQKYFSWPIITTQNFEYSKGLALRYTPGAHISSTFAGHYDLATYLVFVLPTIFGLLFTFKDRVAKLFTGIIIVFSLWLLVNSVSRISVVSYMGGVTLLLILIKKYKTIPLFIIGSIILVLISTDLVARYSRVIEVGVQKIIKIEKINHLFSPIYAKEIELAPESEPPVFEDRSTSIRFNVEWPRAIRAFVKNPLLGTGFSSITLATDSHYLRLLGEVGMLGFFAFFLIFIRILPVFLSRFPISNKPSAPEIYIAGVVSAIPGVLLNAVFIDVFEASKFAITFWLFLGFTVGLARLKRNEDKN